MYDDIDRIPLLFLMIFGLIIMPFGFMVIMTIVNIFVPLQNSNLIKLVLEIVQFLHFILMARVPKALKNDLNEYIFIGVFTVMVALSRLVINVPAFRLLYELRYIIQKGGHHEEKFTKLSEEEIEKKK